MRDAHYGLDSDVCSSDLVGGGGTAGRRLWPCEDKEGAGEASPSHFALLQVEHKKQYVITPAKTGGFDTPRLDTMPSPSVDTPAKTGGFDTTWSAVKPLLTVDTPAKTGGFDTLQTANDGEFLVDTPAKTGGFDTSRRAAVKKAKVDTPAKTGDRKSTRLNSSHQCAYRM